MMEIGDSKGIKRAGHTAWGCAQHADSPYSPWERKNMLKLRKNMLKFAHARDLGDIIYSLPAIKARGGGELHLKIIPGCSAHGMTPERVAFIRPLLESQSYISKVVYPSDEACDVDFCHPLGRASPWRCIADWYCSCADVDPKCVLEKWLEVGKEIGCHDFVVSRSGRVNNPFFPWKEIVERLAAVGRQVFLGTVEETRSFETMCDRVGLLAHPTPENAREMAQWIAGSKLFIGNSSLPLAIAEGLKVPCVVELDPTRHDIHVCRPKRWECSGMYLDFAGILDTLGL
jgi:hypothetical protein